NALFLVRGNVRDDDRAEWALHLVTTLSPPVLKVLPTVGLVRMTRHAMRKRREIKTTLYRICRQLVADRYLGSGKRHRIRRGLVDWHQYIVAYRLDRL